LNIFGGLGPGVEFPEDKIATLVHGLIYHDAIGNMLYDFPVIHSALKI
jgi:hypothetical protein